MTPAIRYQKFSKSETLNKMILKINNDINAPLPPVSETKEEENQIEYKNNSEFNTRRPSTKALPVSVVENKMDSINNNEPKSTEELAAYGKGF